MDLLPKKLKPARKQVKAGDVVKSIAPQTGKEYNIWYNKWAGGDREDSYSNKEKAQTRCNIRRDAGLTRADKTGMTYICLFFSRGCCPYGFECEYLHTLPLGDAVPPETSKDCFARDKFADYRDDMGGVGSFGRINRTLYVGRVKETGDGDHTEEVVRRHFSMFGEIERIRILQHRSVAFVTYVSEFCAQFAKEAMACQSLDNDEILNVRWATEDPNPTQKVAEKERLEELGQEAIQGKIDSRIVDAVRSIKALEEERVLEDEDHDLDETSDPEGEPVRKRLKLDESDPSKPLASTLLKPDTLDSLKYFAQIQRRQQKRPSQPLSGNTLLLAGYGSDED